MAVVKASTLDESTTTVGIPVMDDISVTSNITGFDVSTDLQREYKEVTETENKSSVTDLYTNITKNGLKIHTTCTLKI